MPINVLADEVIRHIAAGEIIDRPARVVKELLDNALDAESRLVVVEIDGGGLEAIRVSDDGVGMSSEDAELAPVRHATSKITSIEDLDRCATLGFRGEALFAMAMAGRLVIQTRQADAKHGTEVVAEGGDIQSRPFGCRVGSRISVERLFSRMPTRRATQQSASVELRRIQGLVRSVALTRHDVHFRLVSNGRTVFDWPRTTDIRDRVRAVLGVDTEPVEGSFDGITIKGCMREGTMTRGVVTVNGRLVQNPAIIDHLERLGIEAWIDIALSNVDVNVSVTKHVVGIRDEARVISALSALFGRVEQARPQRSNAWDEARTRDVGAVLAHTFFVVHGATGSLYVDQHSASERLIYEQLGQDKLEFRSIEPVHLAFDAGELSVLEMALADVRRLGLDVRLDDRGVWLLGVPVLNGRQADVRDIRSSLGEVIDSGMDAVGVVERLRRRVACALAVKAGSAMSMDEAQELWSGVRAMDLSELDVHGRSGAVWVSAEELRRRVGRGG